MQVIMEHQKIWTEKSALCHSGLIFSPQSRILQASTKDSSLFLEFTLCIK